MQNTRATTPKGRPARPAPDPAHLAKVRTQFEEAGITVSGWAKANGFARMTVMDVLHGRRAGHHGEAHRVAVALGLKRGRVVDVKLFKPAQVAAKEAA